VKSARRAVLVPILLFAALTPALGETAAQAGTIGCTELVSWLAGGVSSTHLTHVVDQRGISFIPTQEIKQQLKSAGAETVLLASLPKHPAGNANATTCPAELINAAEMVRQTHYDSARQAFRQLIQGDRGNGALHFALGAILIHQNSWEDAFAEFTTSARLMPGFAETHSRLSYLFYHSGDPDDAIAEARTALSLDPGNPEA